MTKVKQLKSKLKKEGDFVPPDGGWGWMIIVAAGLSNLSMLPVLQQFGLLFREKFTHLGMSHSETTTIINMHTTLCSCVGLANGPMFRTFTYRQVSLTGGFIVFIALVLTTFSYNFVTYLLTFSILYGASYGITSSANALALNVYWKNRRRLATGLSWTATGLGPIIWPQIITVMFSSYGESGTILILSAVALHTVVCGLLLQPVEWHAKNLKTENDIQATTLDRKPNDSEVLKYNQDNSFFSRTSKFKNLSAFSSQYLFNEDDPLNPGYEITDPGIPMMLRSNDGYFSQSKSRLASTEASNRNSQLNSRINSKGPSTTNLLELRSRKSSTLYLNESKKNSAVNLGVMALERDVYKSKRQVSVAFETQIPESEIEDCPTLKAPQDLKAGEKVIEKSNYVAVERNEKNIEDSKNTKSAYINDQYWEKYNKDNHSHVSLKHQDHETEDKKYTKDNHSNQSYLNKHRRKSNNFNYENEILKQASMKLEQYLRENVEKTEKAKLLTPEISINGNNNVSFGKEKMFNIGEGEEEHEIEKDLTFCQKVTLFFDLDLLKDFTFVNLMIGMTIANFSETNFSLLTPFILGDFGIPKSEVALFMSILGAIDVLIRFCVPFIAGKIGWHNNSFYLFGVISMAMGRIILAHCQTFNALILVAVIIGFGKGLRTVFMALVIPTHVPLHKLPGATGIQLVTAGIVSFTFGPIVGWIQDRASTKVALYCLNIFTVITATSWGLEKYFTSRNQKEEQEEEV